MTALPMKPEYGPTLGRLLEPRWKAASSLTRRATIAGGVVLVAIVAAIVLTLLNATYSHGGRVPFSFSYRGLYSVTPDPRGYVKVQRRDAAGRLSDSFAVDPLTLPPYMGEPTGALALYADGYIRGLERRYGDFALIGEGKLKIAGIYGYGVFYTVSVDGRQLDGRDVLLVEEHAQAREGVAISMLALPSRHAEPSFTSNEAAVISGVLSRPFKTFSFG